VSAPLATEAATAAAAPTEPCSTRSPAPGVTRAAWRIEGLDCPDCARSVGIAVERLSGVSCVDLNYASRLCSSTGGRRSCRDIVGMVTAAGSAPFPRRNGGGSVAERSWLVKSPVATYGAVHSRFWAAFSV
jgi:copper chaperone CopZ